MHTREEKNIYCDGGCVLKNPSDIGIVWAYCITDQNDELLRQNSGFIRTSAEVKGTNNVAEMWAAVEALESMELGWSGNLYCDSKITLGRLFEGNNTRNLPIKLIERAKEALKRVGAITPKHLDGHATEKQLKAGFGKHGNPVSKWNNECDNLCNKAKEPYKMEKK